jgi:hypothetical protein
VTVWFDSDILSAKLTNAIYQRGVALVQRFAFRLVVFSTLALGGFFGLVVWQPELLAALLGREEAGHVSEHFREHHHRVHDLTFSFLLGTALVGMVAQLRAPLKNIASQLLALTPFVGLVLASVLTNTAVLSVPWVVLGSFTLLAATLHPAGRELFGSFSVRRANRLMLALVVAAAPALLAFAFTNIGLQRTANDDHAALGHYGFMAAFSFTVVGVGLVASLGSAGSRLTAWVAGLLPALLGIASIAFTDVPSSLGLVWALAAIAWSIAFVVAELTRPIRAGPPVSVAQASGPTVNTSGAPTAAIVSGVIVVGLVALFVAAHLTGAGPSLHGVP